MSEVMSKKERMARQAATINVIKVNPRPGNFCKYYVDPTKMPKAPPAGQRGPEVSTMPQQKSTRSLDTSMKAVSAQNRYLNERQSYFTGPQARRGAPMPP